jgi:hypothetical protein
VLVPGWLAAGLAIAAALTVVFAVVFALGERLYPARPGADRGDGPDPAGDRKRRAEIREYLGAIDERFVEDHPVAGETVAFYLPSRDVAITFDARRYFRLDTTDTRTVLVEHEMPGGHLGARLPFETPTAEFDPGSRPAFGADTAAAFAEFGLDPDTDAETLRAAYRDRVKEAHPDRDGDPETFQRVQEAYATAREHL